MTSEPMTAVSSAIDPATLDRGTIRERLAAALRDSNRQRARGDLALMQKLADEGEIEPASGMANFVPTVGIPPVITEYTQAAVLIPLVEHDDGYKVLLTLRTAALKKHSGQVAFPGGRMDPGDADAEACALREAREETGLDVGRVEVLGRLTSWSTGTGYNITPVVGAVTPPLNLNPAPDEVAAAFEVPLAFFLDPANHRRVFHDFGGSVRAFYEMPYEDRYIWGATAGMLLNLYYALMP